MIELNYFHFLVVSALLFAIGAYGLVTRRNLIRMLLSAEVMLNSALLALLSMASIRAPPVGGLMALLAIGIAAAEVGVVVSLAILLFHIKRKVDIYELSKFKR